MASLYVGYALSRALASDDRGAAVDRGRELAGLEARLRLDWETTANRLFAQHQAYGVVGAYWYSTAHYVVTLAVLVWLFRSRPLVYVRARRALVLATSAALLLYLAVPTAPPRLSGGYVDVLARTAGAGWWGGDASAPRGLGGFTDVLAAFPSMHAGWSLWVAVVVHTSVRSPTLRAAGWLYAATTAVVVIGTGNHWVVDVLAGWSLVGVAWAAIARVASTGESAAAQPHAASTADVSSAVTRM